VDEVRTQRRPPAPAPAVRAVTATPGQPLGPAVRAEMELSLGADFGAVRVHDDELANRSSAGLGALAYTTGEHVVFRRGRFDPASPVGQARLRHELTHVIQQRRGGVETVQAAAAHVSSPGDRFEAHARRSADTPAPAAAAPTPASGSAGPGSVVVQRDPDPLAPASHTRTEQVTAAVRGWLDAQRFELPTWGERAVDPTAWEAYYGSGYTSLRAITDGTLDHLRAVPATSPDAITGLQRAEIWAAVRDYYQEKHANADWQFQVAMAAVLQRAYGSPWIGSGQVQGSATRAMHPQNQAGWEHQLSISATLFDLQSSSDVVQNISAGYQASYVFPIGRRFTLGGMRSGFQGSAFGQAQVGGAWAYRAAGAAHDDFGLGAQVGGGAQAALAIGPHWVVAISAAATASWFSGTPMTVTPAAQGQVGVSYAF
jgi:hypothetical protein